MASSWSDVQASFQAAPCPVHFNQSSGYYRTAEAGTETSWRRETPTFGSGGDVTPLIRLSEASLWAPASSSWLWYLKAEALRVSPAFEGPRASVEGFKWEAETILGVRYLIPTVQLSVCGI